MLIIFGVLFIVIENVNHGKRAKINSIAEIGWGNRHVDRYVSADCSCISGYFPFRRNDLGGILLGLSRTTAAEFTFFLAVPVMAGAGLLKLVKFGLAFSAGELVILLVGMAVAFVVSIIVIRFPDGLHPETQFQGIWLVSNCSWYPGLPVFRTAGIRVHDEDRNAKAGV